GVDGSRGSFSQDEGALRGVSIDIFGTNLCSSCNVRNNGPAGRGGTAGAPSPRPRTLRATPMSATYRLLAGPRPQAPRGRGGRPAAAWWAVGALAGLVAGRAGGQEEVRQFNDPILVVNTGGHSAPVRALAFTPDGAQLLSAGMDKLVNVWDLGDGR